MVSLVCGDEVRSKVVPDVTGASLRKAIEQDCRPAETVLHTDEGGGYRSIAREFARHETVNHSAGEYVRGAVTINRAESYFSQLKRSLDGTHHHVSREHCPGTWLSSTSGSPPASGATAPGFSGWSARSVGGASPTGHSPAGDRCESCPSKTA